jgi:hypothetical protein
LTLLLDARTGVGAGEGVGERAGATYLVLKFVLSNTILDKFAEDDISYVWTDCGYIDIL